MNKVAIYFYYNSTSSVETNWNTPFQSLNDLQIENLLVAFSITVGSENLDETITQIINAFPLKSTPAYHFFVLNENDERIYLADSLYGYKTIEELRKRLDGLINADITFSERGIESISNDESGNNSFGLNPFFGASGNLPGWLLLMFGVFAGYKALDSNNNISRIAFGGVSFIAFSNYSKKQANA